MKTTPLIRIFYRQSRAHPLRTILLILGIALGVAGVVAMDMAKSSVSKSFELSVASLSSRSTHRIVGSTFDIDQSVFTDVRTRLGITRSAPVISRDVTVAQLDHKPLTFMGIDPFSEGHFRDVNLEDVEGGGAERFRQLMADGTGVFIAGSLAGTHGLALGDTLTLSLGTRREKVAIAGFLESGDRSTEAMYEGLVLTDIAVAQEILGMGDRIDRIDLILDEPHMEAAVRQSLPQGVLLVKTARHNEIQRGLSQAFETNLSACSMLALFMGMFLIYNTVSFSVAQRRKLNGLLRCLGVTRPQIFGSMIAEIMIYALVGSGVGILLGILLGKGAVQAVTGTVSDLYYVLTVSRTSLPVSTVFKGVLAGLGTSLAACVFPALSAAKTVPITLMQRFRAESGLKTYIPYLFGSGIAINLAALALLRLKDSPPTYDFAGVFLLFLGFSLFTPLAVMWAVKGVRAAFSRRTGSMTRMALNNVLRSLSSTSVLISSLMVVIAVYIGITVMTQSFRQSIIEWVDGHIGGDIHVSSSDQTRRALDHGLLEKVNALDQVEAVSAYNIHRVFSRTAGEIHVFSYIHDLSEKQWTYTASGENAVDRLLSEGWVIVSEVFAKQYNLAFDTPPEVVLDTSKGPVSFRVAGVFRDFFLGGGRVVVSRSTMADYWGYDDITSMQIFLKDKAQIDPTILEIQAFLPDKRLFRVVSGQTMKNNILAAFDKTFIITVALQLLTALVALTGVLSSVMALVLERSREIAVLRVCGAVKTQIARLILSECGVFGILSGLFALPLGLILSRILIDVINRKSFGWSYEMLVLPGVLTEALVLSFVAAFIAGIYPAIKAGRTRLSEALHME